MVFVRISKGVLEPSAGQDLGAQGGKKRATQHLETWLNCTLVYIYIYHMNIIIYISYAYLTHIDNIYTYVSCIHIYILYIGNLYKL